MTRTLLGRPAAAGRARGTLAGTLLAAAASLLLAIPANSASISYILDQSNVFADGVDYMKVTLSDGANGAVDFKVEMLDALTGMSTEDHFGIQSFAFNVVSGTETVAHDVSGLPHGWTARNQKRMDGFGLFDIRVQGPGKKRVDELDFSVTGIDLDTLLSYADFSTGRAPQGHVYFAARVVGLDACKQSDSFKKGSSSKSGESNNGNGDDSSNWDDDCHHVHGAYFGGPGTVVPAPAAVLLFGSGIGLLGVVRRRMRRS